MPKRPAKDQKKEALRKQGTLHPRPSAVIDPLFAGDRFFDPRDLLQVKYEMLRRVRVDGQQIRDTARAFGLSRPTFYQAQESFERSGLSGLLPGVRGPRRAHKLSTEVVAFATSELRTDPTLSPAQLADRIRERFQVTVHPRSVERALARAKKA